MTPDADSGTAAHNRAALPRAFAAPATFLLLIGCYLVWQVVLRLVTSNSAELDEGEQLLLTQRLAWGYGPQPPLYTWLQYPFIRLFGPTILPLALFKNLLLFGTYAITYFSARRLTRHHLPAVAATMSLLFVPQISWESQRDLTHSVLVTLLAAATFYVFLRLSEARRPRFYLAFGLCAAMGTLSKYSFLLFLAGLIVAALSLRPFRPVICNGWMLPALALAAALVAPHALWAGRHPDAVFAATGKFHIARDQPWLQTTFVGAKNLAGSVAVHIGALLGIYFILCRKRLTPAPPAVVDRNYVALMGRSLAVIFALLALMILCLRVTSFKDRWLLPVFICLPVYLAAALEPRLNAARVRAMIGIGVVVMGVVSILLPGRIWLAEWRQRPDQPNAPFDQLTAAMRPLIPPAAVLVAENSWMGGNLRMFFPAHPVVTPHWPPHPERQAGDECVLIWDASRSNAPPENLVNFAAASARFELDSNDWHYVEARLKFYQTRRLRLGLMPVRVKDAGAASAPGKSPD